MNENFSTSHPQYAEEVLAAPESAHRIPPTDTSESVQAKNIVFGISL